MKKIKYSTDVRLEKIKSRLRTRMLLFYEKCQPIELYIMGCINPWYLDWTFKNFEPDKLPK